MTYDPNVFGYVDGQPTYSRDEFIYKKRRRGPITDDAELVAFAEKVTSGWYNAGWRRTFTTYYLGDYALDEPLNSMTLKEYNRLKELQKKARDEAEAAEAARCWQHVETIRWADNSVEEVYKDKDGNIKRVMTVAPHGDAYRGYYGLRPACYLDSDLLISMDGDEQYTGIGPQEAAIIVAELVDQFGGTYATEGQFTAEVSFLLGKLRAIREKEADHE